MVPMQVTLNFARGSAPLKDWWGSLVSLAEVAIAVTDSTHAATPALKNAAPPITPPVRAMMVHFTARLHVKRAVGQTGNWRENFKA